MQTLLDFMAHTHDPETSRIAAERHVTSGKRARHAAMVLSLVRRHPGATAVELWENATDDEQNELGEMQEVRRRMVELERDGLVRKGAARSCRVRGSKQVTWDTTNNVEAVR